MVIICYLLSEVLSFQSSNFRMNTCFEPTDTAEIIPPTTEEWGVDEWNPVEQVTMMMMMMMMIGVNTPAGLIQKSES